MDVGTSSLQGKLWKQDLTGLRHFQCEKNPSKYLIFGARLSNFGDSNSKTNEGDSDNSKYHGLHWVGFWLAWVSFKPVDVLMILRSGPSHCHMALGTEKLGREVLWCVLWPLEGNN